MDEEDVCLTHGGACMALREFAQRLAQLAVIQKDLPIRSDARKVVSARRIPYVQDELGVRLYRLVRRRGLWLSSYGLGAP